MPKSTHISRREFLERAGKAAGLAVVVAGAGLALHKQERFPFRQTAAEVVVRDLRVKDIPGRLVVVRGEDPARMTSAALHEFGGMSSFVSNGDTVVVKPNIGWDRVPEQAANTNPQVVRVLVRECLAAGAAKVIVTDVSCNDPRRCFYRSGIAQSAEEAGAEVELPSQSRYRPVNMGGVMLGEQLVYGAFLEADKVINVPVAKHHSLTRATLGMKNLYGILGGNRSRLHQDINNSIADLGNFLRPTLTVLDAYRVLLRNGPQGGNLADVEERRMLAVSNDPVAVDAYAGETFFGLAVEDLPYLSLAEHRGLGITDYSALDFREIEA